MYGRVTKYFPDRGFGFILGKDNNSYFVHYSNLNNECLERGYYVSFVYNAKDIIVIESAECYARKLGGKNCANDGMAFLLFSACSIFNIHKL